MTKIQCVNKAINTLGWVEARKKICEACSEYNRVNKGYCGEGTCNGSLIEAKVENSWASCPQKKWKRVKV